MDAYTENKPKFSKAMTIYSIVTMCSLLFFLLFISNVEWEARISGLLYLSFLLVILPLGVYLYFFLKKLNQYTLKTESKKLNQYPKFYIIIVASILGLFSVIAGVFGVYFSFENKAKHEIITYMITEAEKANLRDVKIIVNSKNTEYGFYNVIVECSNLDEFSYKELFDLERAIRHSDAFITSYRSNGDTYEIFPSTLSIYKNGESVYSDYWNSSSHKSASTNKSGYGGYHGTRPGSVAESIEIAASKVKCKECGLHSDNGYNSLCDYCWKKKNQ